MDDRFTHVGIIPEAVSGLSEQKRREKLPVTSTLILSAIIAACLLCELFMPKDPTYMDLHNANQLPGREFLFGTDSMGRDIFSMIWYGGRVSLFIGFAAAAISAALAIIIGTISGLAPKWLDEFIMRATEIFLSIPNLLLVVFIQALLGKANVLSISLVIGITGWTTMAKVVRTEVRQIRESEYVIAARCLGAGLFHILRKHLLPNFIPSIMFMMVMNIRGAIVAESTLSFMGIGLPLDIISWGSMLSLAEGSLLSGSWWIILIPGVFLVITMLCITDIGNYIRKNNNKQQSNL